MAGSLPTRQTEGSPFEEGESFRPLDYLNISIYSFGLRGFTFALTSILVPVLLLDIVAEDRKNTYLGLATFAAMMVALVAQPVAGTLSDRHRLPFGKRHPFILVGTLIACLLLPGLVLTENFVVFLLVLAVITMGINIAQGPFQAFIPDLVPSGKQGTASAYKTGAEIAGVAAIAGLGGYLIGQYQAPDGFRWVWFSIALLGGVYLSTMVMTLAWVREEPNGRPLTSVSAPIPRQDARDRFFPPGFGWFLMSRFLFLSATGILETFGLFYLRDVVEVDRPAQAAGMLTVIIGGAALVGAVVAGRLMSSIGYRHLIASAGGIGAAGIFMLIGASDLMTVLVAGSVIGVGVGIFFTANWGLAVDLVSPARAAQQMGLTSIATMGGTAAARLLGIAVDALNTEGVQRGYEGLFLISGVAFLLGGILVYAVRPAKQEQPAGQGSGAGPPEG